MNDPLTIFPPSRTEALHRLKAFLPHAGRDYAAQRNYDPGPDAERTVSTLSPYIRARLLTEAEVVDAVLGRHALSSSEKFVKEVFWRTYWKGWLELRPSVWRDYQGALRHRIDDLQTQAGLRQRWEAACKGQSGIACFDAWANELVATGYLHNHARMWFASIWVFTLRLPWELGADFFLRHLLDGDSASNTLGWRWVAGLQTRGKTYLARADNIEKYTKGRFNPVGELATSAQPISGPPAPERKPLPAPEWMEPRLRTGLLLHDDDLAPGHLLDAGLEPVSTAVMVTRDRLSPLQVAPHVSAFATAAVEDVTTRWAARLGSVQTVASSDEIARWARAHGIEQIVTPYAPVGPNADMLSALSVDPDLPALRRIMRTYDRNAWPNATAGFFKFKDKIPKLIGQLRGMEVSS